MREHLAIIDALLAGKRRQAAELLHRHLATSMKQTLEHMPADLSSIRTGKIRLAEKETVTVVRPTRRVRELQMRDD